MGSYFNRTSSVIAATDSNGTSILFAAKKWTYVSKDTESSFSIRSLTANGSLSRRSDARDGEGHVSDHVVAIEEAIPEIPSPTPPVEMEVVDEQPQPDLESEVLKETEDPATGDAIPAPLPKKRRG